MHYYGLLHHNQHNHSNLKTKHQHSPEDVTYDQEHRAVLSTGFRLKHTGHKVCKVILLHRFYDSTVIIIQKAHKILIIYKLIQICLHCDHLDHWVSLLHCLQTSPLVPQSIPVLTLPINHSVHHSVSPSFIYPHTHTHT